MAVTFANTFSFLVSDLFEDRPTLMGRPMVIFAQSAVDIGCDLIVVTIPSGGRECTQIAGAEMLALARRLLRELHRKNDLAEHLSRRLEAKCLSRPRDGCQQWQRKRPFTCGPARGVRATRVGCRSAVVPVGRQSTQTRPSGFSEAARRPDLPLSGSVSAKQPLVTTRTRPQPALRDLLRIPPAGPPCMTGLRRPT